MLEMIINTLFSKKNKKCLTFVRPKNQCEEDVCVIVKRERFKTEIAAVDTELTNYFIYNKGLNKLERSALYD